MARSDQKKKRMSKVSSNDKLEKEAHSASKKNLKRSKLNKNLRSASTIAELTEDDRTIHTMERLMKIKKRQLPSSFAQDGLDYLLDVVNRSDAEMSVNTTDDDASKSDESSGTESDVIDDDKDDANDESDVIDDGVLDESDVMDDDEDLSEDEVIMQSDSNDDDSSSAEDVTSGDDDYDETEYAESPSQPNKASIGAFNANTKYVPPAFRVATGDETKKYEIIKRQLKGLINRVSEANLHSICVEIESFYKTNSRARITQILSDVILVQFFTPDPIAERLIIESTMVVAVLCHNIGNEVVAYFLEAVCKKLNELLRKNDRGAGKESNNVVQLICGLYQFKIIQKQLVLDIVQLLISSFSERDIELLVVVLKSTGFQLRKDDPVTLKSIVEQVTLKSSACHDEQSSRMKFMLEILTAIKNNNVRKVLGYDVDQVNNRRKRVKSICNNQSDVFSDVKFDDLVNADHQGRWWIVGSSWGGAPMLKARKEEKHEPQVSAKLIQAAKKLRMNTDIRKRIFYAVMSSTDFIEGFENINQLKLSGKQQREICHVVVECCQREKTFNPYYFHLINKFCHRDRQFVMTTQCSFWDRVKCLKTLSDKQSMNIAKLLSNLLLSGALPLSCLKTFEFSQIEKSGVSFLRRVLSNLAKDAKSVAELDQVFLKLDSKKHGIVKNGLRLFIQHFMLKDDSYMKQNTDLELALTRMDQKLDSQRQSFIHDVIH